MLGIPIEIIPLLKTPQANSWISPILERATDWEKEQQMEEILSNWIQQTAALRFPGSQLTDRIIRESILLTLERKAIARFLKENPQWIPYLPKVTDPHEGARLGAREAMADQNEEKQAAILLSEMEQATLRPDPLTMAQLMTI